MITVICGSHKKNSQSLKVARYSCARLMELYDDADPKIVNLGELAIPFWDEEFENVSEHWKTMWAPVSKQLVSSDGIIIITPEWGGMAPPMLKNFFLLCDVKELGHKPALIISISSGTNGGSYPIAELRSSSYKNNRVCYIPEQIVIREVKLYLNDPVKADGEADLQLRKRIDFCFGILTRYIEALKLVRQDGDVIFNDLYKYGM